MVETTLLIASLVTLTGSLVSNAVQYSSNRRYKGAADAWHEERNAAVAKAERIAAEKAVVDIENAQLRAKTDITLLERQIAEMAAQNNEQHAGILRAQIEQTKLFSDHAEREELITKQISEAFTASTEVIKQLLTERRK